MHEKRLEFETIRQGNQIVAEYLNQFTHLLRYAGNISEEDKGMKFLYGMRQDFREHVVGQCCITVDQMAQIASLTELNKKRKDVPEFLEPTI